MASIPRQRNLRGVLAGVAVVIMGAGGMTWSASDDAATSAPEPVVAPVVPAG